MNPLKYICNLFLNLFTKDSKAEGISDKINKAPVRNLRKVIILDRDDLIDSVKDISILDISMRSFKMESVSDYEWQVAKFIVFRTPGCIKVLKDVWNILELFPNISVREGNLIKYMEVKHAANFLADEGYANVFWSIANVQERLDARGIDFDSFQAEEVIEYINETYDPSVGINWGIVDDAIDSIIGGEDEEQ